MDHADGNLNLNPWFEKLKILQVVIFQRLSMEAVSLTRHSIRSIQKRASKATDHFQCKQRKNAAQRAVDYLLENKHLSISSEKGPCIWNFGFGANINPWKLEQRRNIHPIGDKLRGKLTGWRLLFDHKGGFGNIINMETETSAHGLNAFEPFINENQYEVNGVLLKLTHEDLIKLASMEHEYELHQISIQIYPDDITNGNSFINALIFKSPRYFQTKRSDLYPPSRYIEIIQKGARQMNIDQKYCLWLSQINSIEGHKRSKEYYDVCST